MSKKDDEKGLSAGFGPYLRGLREDKGLSQVEAASRAGISDRHWKRLEAGTSSPTRRMLADVAAALGVDPRTLFERAGFDRDQGDYMEPKLKRSLFGDMLRKYQSLAPRQQRKLRLTLEMLDRQLDRMLAERDE